MAQPNSPTAPSPAADTIYALSSGAPPAAIAIVRISGTVAGDILRTLAGALPSPRRASYRALRDRHGEMLDHAMVLWLPGPRTATGENLAELHLHGGRAVVAAVLAALADLGLRMAEPGEFTRRALFNGQIDLTAAEGLADLLAAETESQRREALRRADGVLGRKLAGWMQRLTDSAAALEVAIDYDGDDGGDGQDAMAAAVIDSLVKEIAAALAMPPAERLKDGVRIAIVGPPNAGKSTLFNALVGADAAIVSDIPGTTRDTIERPMALAGMPIVLIDTAGIRNSNDPIESLGIARAVRERATADIILDLEGGELDGRFVIPVSAKADAVHPRAGSIAVSVRDGSGLTLLRERVAAACAGLLPGDGEIALDRRYRAALTLVLRNLVEASVTSDPVLVAEHIRRARAHLGGLIGGGDVEAMLDALFGRFCLGK